MQTLTLLLYSVQDTIILGKILGSRLLADPGFALLLQGDLGTGKTTLTRAIVQTLPGAEFAEISSPSFNILNIYPTRPEVMHFDLYRLEDQGFDAEMADYLDSPETLVIVEWVQFLPSVFWPGDYILINLQSARDLRKFSLTSKGNNSSLFLKHCKPELLKYLGPDRKP